MGYSRPLDLTGSQLIDGAQAAPTENKLLGLELVRFASAIAVLCNHYRFFAHMDGVPSVARSDAPFYSILWPLYNYGYFGVEVFWGISGYIFFWKYSRAISDGLISGRQFFWLRFSRLYPLHFATLLLVAMLQPIHAALTGQSFVYQNNDLPTFIAQLAMATHWTMPLPYTFNGPIWSVSAEVAVYAGFYLLLRRVPPTRNLCMAVVLTSLTCMLAGVDWVPVSCATFFFAGGFAALVPAKSKTMASAALVTLGLLCAMFGMFGDQHKMPMFMLAATPCLLVLLSREVQLLNRWQGMIRFAGNLTYSSYLLHFPLLLILAICASTSGILPPLTSPWFLFAYLGVTLAISAVSYRTYELPVQQWLRRSLMRGL